MTPSPPLRVLFLASEADPFVKVGGLGDVAGSLPPVIHHLTHPGILSLSKDTAGILSSSKDSPGILSLSKDDALPPVDIRLVIPYHSAINPRAISPAHPLQQVASFDLPHSNGPLRADIFQTALNGMTVYLVGGAPMRQNVPVYSSDLGFDGYKYVFFSLASLELARHLDWQPHLVHANDWHTAAALYAISLRRATDPFYAQAATVLSVHNLPYLGAAADASLHAFGLPPALDSSLPDWAIHIPLPLGLLAADRIVAVSPTYAQEIMTPDYGSGLHDFLRGRQDRVMGILNGLDIQRWNPAADGELIANYNAETLERRKANKVSLRDALSLDPERTGIAEETPLLVMITRMDRQKGVDLMLGALNQVLDLPWQAVILGTGQFEIEAMARDLEQNHPQRVRAVIRFDPILSRRLYAAGDMIVIPSRYEPCGLTQMIAMRYGCIPVARATGGLRDTIQDGKTGYCFDEASPEALACTLRRALKAYQNQAGWQAMQQLGMQTDFSWERSAQEYIRLYLELINQRSLLRSP